MKVKVIKMPDVKRIRQLFLEEISEELTAIGKRYQATLSGFITDWDNRTRFRYETTVQGQWRVSIFHNSQSKEGKIFDWVNNGTGEQAGGSKYPIRPHGDYPLRFIAPHSPKTLAPGQSPPSGVSETVFTYQVMHPGIKPRKFTENVIDKDDFLTKVKQAAQRGLIRR